MVKKKDFNILVVDDSREDRVILVENLRSIESQKNRKFNIVQVNNISRALDIIENDSPDIVFLDFIMGESDGLHLLSDLTDEQKKKTPIIMITSCGNELIEEDSISIGAKKYIDKKNINQTSLSEVLEKVA